MNPQVTDPNYKPIQFTANQIRIKYERKRQQEEHDRRQIASLKALAHETLQEELEQGWN